MSPKNAVTTALLVFVLAAILVITVRALRQPTEIAAPQAPPVENGVVAYYFHGQRCATCRMLEEYCKEVVDGQFAPDLENGSLVWEVVDYTAPGNEHYVTDYDVVSATLVLVEMKNGKQRRFANLMRIWELKGDKAAMQDYVAAQIHDFLGDEEATAPSDDTIQEDDIEFTVAPDDEPLLPDESLPLP